MRIADKMAFEQVNSNVSKNRSQMSELQNQAATQKRVTKPSDDPLAAARVLGSRVDLQGNKQFGKSLAYARSFLEYTDQAMADLTEVMVRAKELAVSQSNDASASDHTRRVVATEVEQLHDQVVQIGNRKLGDRFIFGGYKTLQAPFDARGNYAGDGGEMMIHADKDAFLAMNVPGSRVFLGDGFTRLGPNSVTPEQPRTIEELQETRQQATEPHGAEPQGPASAPQPSKPQPVEMRGPASGPSTQNTAAVSVQTGHETDSGMNLFRVLKDFEIALRTNDKAGVQDCLDSIDQAIQQVVLTRAQVGARSTTLDNLTQTKEKEKVEDQIMISSLEDADIYSTVSDITKTESTLQATLQTSGKLIQKSLMDFLR